MAATALPRSSQTVRETLWAIFDFTLFLLNLMKKKVFFAGTDHVFVTFLTVCIFKW